MGCCASTPTSDAPPSRPSTSGPRRPVLTSTGAGVGTGTGGTRGTGSVEEATGDPQSSILGHASTQGGAAGNASDDDGAGVGAATSGKRSKSAAATRRRKDRAATLDLIPSRSGEALSSQKSPTLTSPEQHDTRHNHGRRRRRNSPSRPLPNTPLRPAPPSSTIRCPVDVLNTSSPLSNSRSTLLSLNTTKSSSYGINAHHAWTRARLTRERIAFFDTRVTGAPEIWAAVRAVVELVRDDDLTTAQGLLDAAGCTCPTGEVARGVYDERGRLYELPDWVVGDPGDLVEDEGDKDDGDRDRDRESSFNGTEYKNGESVYGESYSSTGSESETGKNKEKKTGFLPGSKRSARKERSKDGKLKKKLDNTSTGGDKGKTINVKIRLSDRVGDLEVSIGAHDRISVLIAMVREKAKLPTNAKVRIAYLGRVLLEQESLKAQGWYEGQMVNGLVFAG